MLIRPATDSDFPAIAALTNHYIEKTSIHFGYEPLEPASYLQQWRASRGRFAFLVAQLDGAFAGYAKTAPWRDRAAYAWTAETGVYVKPELHRRGVGKALYHKLIDVSRAQGFHTLVAGVTLPNDPSVRLHESVGFVRVGTFRQVGWKFEHWHDVGFWELPLTDRAHGAQPLRPPDAL